MIVNKGEVYQSRKEKSVLRIFRYKKEYFIYQRMRRNISQISGTNLPRMRLFDCIEKV